ncbi:MAG: UDP-N-acetylglucosamine diphosphorylase/glucosamine-1-phosphate N-acetyltransferase [Chloroflexi bacterium]|nr:MAG: UDP-N-acetylglucosamine diphosphorylase/glucosamine-1-phosphate N-acetyltransferase [Chloroflexota bacterium]
MKVATVILAAGFGTRMKSDLPKVLHPIAGRPMVEWAVRTAEQVGDLPPVVVVGHGKERVADLLKERVQYAEQKQLLGTGHAVMHAEAALRDKSDAVLVFYADMPLLQASTLRNLVELFAVERRQGEPALAMLTIDRPDSQGFGRVVRNNRGEVQAIVEEVDCTPDQKQITELNPGIYCFDAEWLWANLSQIPASRKGEYYLTDMVGVAVAQGRRVVTASAPLDDVHGINTRVHLAQVAAVMRQRIAEQHMLNGVTIIDPLTTYIDDTVEIGSDTTILPGCCLEGATRIGHHAIIGPYSRLVDSSVGDHCRVSYSVIEQARLDNHADIGPFGRLRPGAHLGEGVHMGSFGEVKNSYLAPGVKMGHFSYIGDSDVGENAMIAAGTITCNFDGVQKNRTVIGKEAFIGSDTLLVAPVTVGDGAKTGAGSVVTRDVPPHTLVYGVPAHSPKKGAETASSNQGGRE